MQSNGFVQRWNDYAVRTDQTAYAQLEVLSAPDSRLSNATNHFLTTVGLPEGAGLRFEDLRSGLHRVYEFFGREDEWKAEARATLENYLIIGSDQGGNPACLDLTNQECLRMLDHESKFAPFAFINSSAAQLAECILIFQEMVETFQNEHEGEEGELYEGNVPPSLVEATLQRIKEIDEAAVVENSYWQQVLDFI